MYNPAHYVRITKIVLNKSHVCKSNNRKQQKTKRKKNYFLGTLITFKSRHKRTSRKEKKNEAVIINCRLKNAMSAT